MFISMVSTTDIVSCARCTETGQGLGQGLLNRRGSDNPTHKASAKSSTMTIAGTKLEHMSNVRGQRKSCDSRVQRLIETWCKLWTIWSCELQALTDIQCYCSLN